MANENANREMKETAQLVQNRLGIQPKGVNFSITNRMIEDALINHFQTNNLDTEADPVYVSVRQNPRYRFGNDGNSNGQSPVTILVRVKARVDGSKSKAPKKVANPNIAAIMRNLGSTKGAQIDLIGREELNKTLAGLCRNDEVRWNIVNNKRDWVQAELDFVKVMEFVFAIDKMERKPELNIAEIKISKNGRHNGAPMFSMKVVKYYPSESFKKKNRNPFDN